MLLRQGITQLPVNRNLIRTSVLNGKIRRTHTLPRQGRIISRMGETVPAGDVVGSYQSKGRVASLNVSLLTKTPPSRILETLQFAVDEQVEAGTILAKGPSRLLGTRQWEAPFAGSICHASSLSGHAYFKESTNANSMIAMVSGEVTKLQEGKFAMIEGYGTCINCPIGNNGVATGTILMVPDQSKFDVSFHTEEIPLILVATESVTDDWIASLSGTQISAVVAPSIPLTKDSSQSCPLPVISNEEIRIVLTEGVGIARMPSSLQGLFRSHEGKSATVAASILPGQSEIILDKHTVSQNDLSSYKATASSLLGSEIVPRSESLIHSRNGAGIDTTVVEIGTREGSSLWINSNNIESVQLQS